MSIHLNDLAKKAGMSPQEFLNDLFTCVASYASLVVEKKPEEFNPDTGVLLTVEINSNTGVRYEITVKEVED